MGWFGKKKKKNRAVKEICPEGLYDLHAHVIPGVDDGPSEWEGCLEILKGMEALGFKRITATPHYSSLTHTPSPETIADLVSELNAKWGRSPVVQTGAEIMFDDHFFQHEATESFPRLGPERTYLVEFGFAPGSVPVNVEEVFFKFQIKGPSLVVAHAERIPDLQRDPGRLSTLLKTGAYLQLDVMSLAGRYGREAEETAYKLLEDGLYDFAASDIHSPRDLPTLEEALSNLADWNEEEFIRLTSKNPKALHDGRLDEAERND